MFNGLFDIASVMKQAREFGGKMQDIQERLKDVHVKGTAGAGLVEVGMNGLQEMLSCKIDPTLFAKNDPEFLEELIAAAVNEAVAESRGKHAEMMQSLTAGMNLPGMQDVLKQFTK
ncbi:MAG TPA: YbaB/EbfC family nucleoid-associated protein [Planctomycetaceae bacterium]|nr:YbaB/EbfC family nucleoid-associated protein [Planctomycetaceae bacterium]